MTSSSLEKAPIFSSSNLTTEDEENTSLSRPRAIGNNNAQRANADSNRSSFYNVNILRGQPNYSSLDDASASVASFAGSLAGTGGLSTSDLVDMETLLTMALETTTQRVDMENKKRLNMLLLIIGAVFIGTVCILSTVAFSEYPQDNKLHGQIDSLESDVDQLHSELNTFENDENINLLQRDIEDKKLFIQQLENDQNIDPKEKQKLVDELEDQIYDLKDEVAEMEKTRDEVGSKEIEAAKSNSSGGR